MGNKSSRQHFEHLNTNPETKPEPTLPEIKAEVMWKFLNQFPRTREQASDRLMLEKILEIDRTKDCVCGSMCPVGGYSSRPSLLYNCIDGLNRINKLIEELNAVPWNTYHYFIANTKIPCIDTTYHDITISRVKRVI